MIDTILLDLDNTLYPASSGVARQLSRLINEFTAEFLGVEPEEAMTLRRKNFSRHGTTLKWLQQEYGFDQTEAYFDAVHPRNLEAFLSPNPEVRRSLEHLRNRGCSLAIFTNAPEEHARRVTDFYRTTDLMDAFYDIRFHQLRGKPHPESYRRVLDRLPVPAGRILFVADQPLYLAPFRRLGGHTLLIREALPEINHPASAGGAAPGADEEEYPVIRRIEELPAYLEKALC